MAATPAERHLAAQIAANESWSHTPDRAARTAPARAAFAQRFDTLVDPDGTLPPDERARRAENARRAHFARLALASARARRQAREATVAAEAAEAELNEIGGESA